MDSSPDLPPEDAQAPARPAEAPASAPVLWHAGWGLGVGVCAGILLLVLGQVSTLSVIALAIGALPGLIGFVWRLKGGWRRVLLLPWMVCAAVAASLTGGISGPLGVWCLSPLLAALPMGFAFEGVAAALLAVAGASFAQSSGLAQEPPAGIMAVWLGSLALASTAAGGAGALMLTLGRARVEHRRLEADHSAASAVLADLPLSAAVVDREGHVIAQHGPPLEGLPFDWLDDGLIQAAEPSDRSSLTAALSDALDHGSGDGAFSPAAAPARRFGLKLRRTGEKSLIVVFNETAAPAASRGAELWAGRAQLETLLRAHPDLIALLEPDGRVTPLSVYGRPPEGITPAGLGRAGLVQLAVAEDEPAVVEALKTALETGHAGVAFALREAPGRRVAASLRRTNDGRLVAAIREDTEGSAAAHAFSAREAGLQAALALAQSRAQAQPVAAPATEGLEKDLAQAKAELSKARTDLTEANGARERAEAVARARARFLANMSHELRTPLNAIMGFSDIMRARMFGELTPKYGEYAELIHESGGHLMDLINDILDMSKIEAERYDLRREVFDVREAMTAALRLLRLQADDAGVQLRGVLPQDVLLVDADRRAIKQIVLNLVSNALKFTPREGSVTVTARAAEDALEIVVADTGVGIAREDLERLGQPFEQAGDAQARMQGTGLGLSLVKAFAGLHGGEMNIESTLGEGTAVTVRMPVLAVEDKPAAPAPADDRGARAPVMSGPTTFPSMPFRNS